MLTYPDEVKRTGLKPNWFADPSHRQLAYTLLNTDKSFNDFSEVELEVKGYYPKSAITEEYLHAIEHESMYVNSLKDSVKALEVEYVRSRTLEAAVNYGEYPNQKNKELLEDWLRTMNEMDIEEDEGELKPPVDQLLYELDNEVEHGLSSYRKLDMILGAGLEGGMLIVIAARPGMGKTTYAMNIAIEVLQKLPNTQVDFFSLEMSKVEMLKKNISRLTRINSYKFKNAKVALKDDEKLKVINSANWVSQTGLRLHDSKFKLSAIERMIRQRHHENKGKDYMAIVDYVGLVDGESNGDKRNLEIGKISRTLKKLTNELDIPIMLISQLNRAVESRQDKKPTLSDLRESGDLEQDANVVILLSENSQDTGRKDTVYIDADVAKNRNGSTGIINYIFEKPYQMFSEIELNSDG